MPLAEAIMTASNENFMNSSFPKAKDGLLTLTKTTLFPGIAINRFANTKRPDLFYTGPWWIGFSAFEALKKYASLRKQSLSLAARTCLAIDWEWSNVDVLVKAIIKAPLSAWSGTPKTQTPKMDRRYTGIRWEPDRDITQLFIPGLNEIDPKDASRKVWKGAFSLHYSIIQQA
jgi:hypothetical protein